MVCQYHTYQSIAPISLYATGRLDQCMSVFWYDKTTLTVFAYSYPLQRCRDVSDSGLNRCAAYRSLTVLARFQHITASLCRLHLRFVYINILYHDLFTCVNNSACSRERSCNIYIYIYIYVYI